MSAIFDITSKERLRKYVLPSRISLTAGFLSAIRGFTHAISRFHLLIKLGGVHGCGSKSRVSVTFITFYHYRDYKARKAIYTRMKMALKVSRERRLPMALRAVVEQCVGRSARVRIGSRFVSIHVFEGAD